QTGIFPILIVVGNLHAYDASVDVKPGGANTLTIVNGNNQKGSPGQVLTNPLIAQVTNGCGTPVAGQQVTWAVTQGSATLRQTVNSSDGSGQVSTSLTFGQTPGPIVVTLSIAGGPNVKFNLTNQVNATGIQLTSGNNQTGVVGDQFAQPVTVTVLN